MQKKMLLLVNPVSGKGKGKTRLYETVDIFSAAGYDVTVVPTRSRQHIIEYLTENAKGFDTVVAVGGDGTLNNAVNGIMRSGAKVPLGYIPLGTTNDFAASIGIPTKLKKACEHIISNEPKETDVGKIGEDYFSYIACTGIFAGASYSTPQAMKNALGYGAYIIQGMESLLEKHNVRCHIETESEIFDDEIIFAAVSNAIRAGGVFRLPKDSVKYDDGIFELIMIRAPKGLIDGTKIVNSVISATPSPEVIYRSIKKADFVFESETGWSLDGENGGKHTDIRFEVCEKALLLIR